MTQSHWTLTVEEIDREYVLTFPIDLLERMDWSEGDVLNWTDNSDGSFSLKKVNYGQN